jgi:glycosyltransferase involved in cell wall biosynthesis
MMQTKSNSVYIVIPVFNDWESLSLLVSKLQADNPSALVARFHLVLVNDCSSLDPNPELLPSALPYTLINLNRNVGHQRAIAIGLSYVSAEFGPSTVVVMDSDGEDIPAHVQALVEASEVAGNGLVFAERTRRREGIVFQVSYKLYKRVFKLLTSKRIAFGNFSCIHPKALAKVVHVSEIWNHYSGGVIRSKLPLVTLPLERGSRLAGKSTMNYTSLVMHGLSSIAVHIDTVSIRILIFSLITIVLGFMGITGVLYMKLFTSLAFPNWASTVILGLGTIMMQAFIISLFLAFTMLNYRTQKNVIPAKDYADFILSVEGKAGH